MNVVWPLTLGNGQGRTPLVSQNVEADATVRVDVRVVDARSEVNLRRLERVVCGEVDGEEENTTGVRRVTLQRHVVSHTYTSTPWSHSNSVIMPERAVWCRISRHVKTAQ